MKKLTTLDFGTLCNVIENNDSLCRKLRDHMEAITMDSIEEEVRVLAMRGGLNDWQFSFYGINSMGMGDPEEFIQNVYDYGKTFGMPTSVSTIYSEYTRKCSEAGCNTDACSELMDEYAVKLMGAMTEIFVQELDFVDKAFTEFGDSFREIVSDFAYIVFDSYFVEGNSILHIENVGSLA